MYKRIYPQRGTLEDKVERFMRQKSLRRLSQLGLDHSKRSYECLPRTTPLLVPRMYKEDMDSFPKAFLIHSAQAMLELL
jgi:hypothetical protein